MIVSIESDRIPSSSESVGDCVLKRIGGCAVAVVYVLVIMLPVGIGVGVGVTESKRG